MESRSIQKVGGVFAILEACIYISAFIVYGGLLVYPDKDANTVDTFTFLEHNYITLSTVNFISYVLFGILLAVLVLALHEYLKRHAPNLSKLAFIFGVIWVGLVIASGMITTIGLTSILEIGVTNPEKAMQIWSVISIVAEGLGGGNEIVGGIWVLLISSIAIHRNLFSKALNVLGLLVGLVGILTVYPLDIFTEIFGISQIIWFFWIGIALLRKPKTYKRINTS
ncbi:hypothetical protein GCM10022393_25530 [Aquimarina addita]|uniref:DUF4386 family protein n=1 Tax=Aquimarina addita TaxID=870485 RepID=A0ABP6UKW4_9FLAO